MRKTVKWAAMLLALTMLTGCAQKAEREAPELLDPVGVTANVITHTAYIDDIYKTEFHFGTVEPYVEPLFFNVSGEVEKIHAYPGMNVKKGDALIELDQKMLKERSEQLNRDISYTQQDGAYTDEIAAIDIKILETEQLQMEKSVAALKENEAELKKKTELLTKTAAALKEEEAALQEELAALEAEPEVSAPAPETSEPTPESSEPAPESSEPAPESSEPAPESSAPVPDENKAELIEKELAYVQEELVLTEQELSMLETELAQITADISAAEKEIELKKNEITQLKTQNRQEKELRAQDIKTSQKDLNEVNTAIEENVIRAPFDGKIVYSNTLKADYAQMKPGVWVQAESPALYLADDTRLSIKCPYITEFTIDSADRIYARIGSKDYEVKYVPIDQDTIMAMSVAGEEIITTFEIVASEKEMKEIEAGQSVLIFILSDYEENALVVPSHAVMLDSLTRTKYVYVDENGSRVKRTVKTGTVTNSRTQILEGLEEGDVVHVDK